MTSTARLQPRILAIDLRPQRCGYAVFEGPGRLLDWGVASFRPGGEVGAATAGRRVAELMRVFLPSAIVVRKARRLVVRDSFGVQPILKAIRRKASTRAIPVSLIARKDVRKVFDTVHARTKYEIACRLTVMFPELLWKLPPNRKFYEGEHPAMTTFDAVALGFAYWHSNGTEALSPE